MPRFVSMDRDERAVADRYNDHQNTNNVRFAPRNAYNVGPRR